MYELVNILLAWSRLRGSRAREIEKREHEKKNGRKQANVLPPSNFAFFKTRKIAAIYFATDCKELKLAQTA